MSQVEKLNVFNLAPQFPEAYPKKSCSTSTLGLPLNHMVSRKDRRQFLQWGVKNSVLLGIAPVTMFQQSVQASPPAKVLDVSDARRASIQSGEGWLFEGSEKVKPQTIALNGGACGNCGGNCEGGGSSSSAASGGSNCGASGGGGGCGGGGGGGCGNSSSVGNK